MATLWRTALLLALATRAAAGAPAGPTVEGAAEEDSVRRLYRTALDLFQNGDFQASATVFERIYARAPAEEMLIYNVGASYDKAGDRPAAIEWFKRYLATGARTNEAELARGRLVVLAAPASGSLPAPAPMAPFLIEAATGHTHATRLVFEGRRYVLIGVGAHPQKDFSIGLLVDEAAARLDFPRLRTAAGGADHASLTRGDIAARWVVNGPFGKAARLHFSRDVAASQMRESCRALLAPVLAPAASPDLRRDAEQFLALIDDTRAGDAWVIRTTPAGELFIERDGGRRSAPINPRLIIEWWNLWLGDSPMSPDLKKNLFDRIEILGG
ncbi:MAG: hypothetical protein EXR72_25020 [Myxococcales bacterium]|nr:hypothetical protein [Myxococcales bacterium]